MSPFKPFPVFLNASLTFNLTVPDQYVVSKPTPGKLEYYIEASDIYGNENQTEVYEVDVVEENTSTQDKDGYIPGTDMTSSVIITVIILLIAVLFVTFFYYSKEKRGV